MSEWINCDERMPEPYVFVLVYGPEFGCDMMKYDPVEVEQSYHYIWTCGDERHDEKAWRDQITHWMPLPDFPK